MNRELTHGRQVARRARRAAVTCLAITALLLSIATATTATAMTATAAPPRPAATASQALPGSVQPAFGPDVLVFDPSMPQSQIQAAVDAVAAQQIPNQFGPQRYALLFKPGTYGSAESPLNFQVGYYTEVAGLGPNPGDVVINGAIDVFNQCQATNCVALNNFWRSMSNLTINVLNPATGVYSACHTGEFWAVSQAAPMRRVHVNGLTTLMDYCTGPASASGGFIADSRFDGAQVINGSQQQFLVRNTTLDAWSNGVWNQVFAGVTNAPAQCFPAVSQSCGPYTTLAATPASKEKPYLYLDQTGNYRVFVPSAARNSVGESWSATSQTPGRSLPLSAFYVASPADSARTLNRQLERGRSLLLTPGTYRLDSTLRVERAGTIVLGLGFATVTPTRGNIAMTVEDSPGVDIAGIVFDAGPVNSPSLLQVGERSEDRRRHAADHADAVPTALQDVFFRIGGAHLGKAAVSLLVNSNNVILDDVWAWRADHGTGVGWNQNTAATGLIVNGDNVTATGLFVEHFQKTEVQWNGENGNVVFFQNEMPYDVPSQAAWMSAPTVQGYAALEVGSRVKHFTGYGLGSYSFFNQGVDIFSDNAFVVPVTPGVQLHDLLTIFLDAVNGKGGIRNVINGVGGSSTVANPDVPVTVVTYP
ncbi:adenylyl cyclase [Nakamurella sp. PAMC28650]|uniref:adenylyl cyclase n=1 Tax=Nakamurella sp. PAMC28650 TaxID=2762325 RepID=UPI00164D2EA9|nr:adenylyl cyclase [Nakamurella sp. PAMC28650]QNK79329.1 adenylyl cyclase [Nakamurella sp. PAMC28650]